MQERTNGQTQAHARKAEQTAEAKRLVLETLRKALGVVVIACKKAGVSRSQFYKWKEVDAEFAEAVESIVEEQKDYVEGKLLENINKNDTQSIVFYLSTKAKDRGYTKDMNIKADLTSGGKVFKGFASILPQYPNIEEVIAEQERNRNREEQQ